MEEKDLRAAKDNTALRKIALAVFGAVLLLLVLLSLLYFRRFAREQRGDYCRIKVENCILHGYSQEKNHFINLVGDANIQLPELNQYVAYVSIHFGRPMEQPLNIKLYYAEENHGFDEEHTCSIDLERDTESAVLFVGKEITTCRIDIGTLQNEEFFLESIDINDEEVSTRAIYLEFYKVFVLFLLAAVFSSVLLLLFLYKLDLEKIILVLALSFGSLYLITITPLSVPDEPHHYQSAYWLSNMLLFQWDSSEYGNEEDFDYAGFAGHQNVSSGYIRILEGIGSPSEEGNRSQIPQPRMLDYFVEYLPQAFGIALARITNQNFVRTFFIGRFFNLLFYSICLYFAVKQAPRFKTMFGLIGIMPMALHQAASYSYDGFVNGVSLLLVASIFKAFYGPGLLCKRDLYCILIFGALLVPAKAVYFPILFLTVFIPKCRFKNGREKKIWIFAVWIFAITFLVIFQLQVMSALATGSSQTLNAEGCYNYTMYFVFEHPWQTIKIFAATFRSLAVEWLKCAIGQSMSGLTLNLPNEIIWSYIFVIILSVLNHEKSRYKMEPLIRGSLWLVSIMVIGLVMLSMFLGWTSNFRTIITGVQGRYFVPIIPLLALSMNNQILVLRKNIDKVLIMSAAILQCYTINFILSYTLLH